MFDIYFSVYAECLQGEKIKIIGSVVQLGSWNLEKALQMKCVKGHWKGQAIHIPSGTKFQFKIIKIKNDNSIVWEQLPNNSNRKYKPKSHSQLHLKWSSAEGKVTPITKGSFKINNLPGVLINKGKQNNMKNIKKEQQFDPYRTARDEQSEDQDEQQFDLVRRKMSDQIGIKSSDFQEIYYNNSNLQIICGLLKKIKIYVISDGFDVNTSLHKEIQKQLMELPNNYLARWITIDYFLGKNSTNFNLKFRKRASIFDIQAQQFQFSSLSNLPKRNSFFFILQLETAITLKQYISKVPTCLILQSNQYEPTIQKLSDLSNISLICFDQEKANREFYRYLTKNSQKKEQQSEAICLIRPHIESILKQLQKYAQIEPFVVNTLINISQSQSIKIFSEENTVCLLDGAVINQHPQFVNDLIDNIKKNSILIILCYEDEISEQILSLKNVKNIIISYKDFEKIILDQKQYYPLREFRETIDIFRMKSKLYLQKYGGQITEKENCIIYNLPLSAEDSAAKIQHQYKMVVSKYQFIKITRKHTRIKLIWYLAKQIRLIRTICEIKYGNYGALGNINIIGQVKNIKYLKQDLSLLVEQKQKLFKQKQNTKISYYTFNENEQSSYTIIPSSKLTNKS